MSAKVVFDDVLVVTVKMPKTLVEAVDRYAMKYGLNRSEVIRMALVRFLEEEAKK
jgi:metal-responsive CopG/Arc/MetJ family transcriptional regulator